MLFDILYNNSCYWWLWLIVLILTVAGALYYYKRYEEGKEYPIHCRKKGSLDADEEIILDVNIMAKGYPYYSVKNIRVSPDNKLISFGVEILDDVITVTTGAAVWAADNKTVFYTRKDPETLRSFKIFKHKLGGPENGDETIFEETDTEFDCYAYKTKSKKYIIINSSHTLSQEYRFLEADNPDGEVRILVIGVRYSPPSPSCRYFS